MLMYGTIQFYLWFVFYNYGFVIVLYQGPMTFSTLKTETKNKATLSSFIAAVKRELFEKL